MAQPLVVTVGPLAAADADGAAQSQVAAGAQHLVLNGDLAANTFDADGVCLSQAAALGDLTLNGARVSSVSGAPVAYLPSLSRVYITSTGDDSGVTFTVYGTLFSPSGPVSVVEVVTGSNSSVASTTKQYQTVTRIAASGASAGTVTVGYYDGLATMDMQRRIIITSSGDDTGITFTLTGTDGTGAVITEVLTGANAGAATSALSYKTLTSVLTSGAAAGTVTVGTNGMADSFWVRFDDFAGNSQVAIQCTPDGATGTVQQTLEDPNRVTNTVAPNTFQWTPAEITWLDHPDANLVGFSTPVQGNYGYAPLFARVTLTSGSGSITTTFRQAYMG